MSCLVQQRFTAEIRQNGIDEERFRVTAIVSTEEPGASGEVARASGWLLERFRANPVLLYNHKSHGDDPQNVLGRVLHIAPMHAGLEATVELDADINPKAKLVWEQIKKGTQRGFSVGFIPQSWVSKWDDVEEHDSLTDKERDMLKSGDAYVIFTSQELHELSLVTIPDKPGAVIRNSVTERKNFLERLRENSMKIEDTPKEPVKAPEPVTQAAPVEPVEAPELPEGLKQWVASLEAATEALNSVNDSLVKFSATLKEHMENQEAGAMTEPELAEMLRNVPDEFIQSLPEEEFNLAIQVLSDN